MIQQAVGHASAAITSLYISHLAPNDVIDTMKKRSDLSGCKFRPQPVSMWTNACVLPENTTDEEISIMKFEPNISKPMRIVYVAVGAVLIAIPFAATWEGWIRLVFPVLGAITVVEGLVGW